MSLKKILRGTGVAVVTPFNENEEIDFTAFGKLLDFVADGGVEYVVILGTTGEAPVLDKKEKIEIINYTYSRLNGKIPVVVGIGGNNTNALINELKEFPLENATAVLSASPYYSKPSQDGIIQHYHALADNSPCPVILYNIPGRTGRNMTAETTIKLASHPNIQGMKESSGDFMQIMQILKHAPDDFLVVSGDDAVTVPLIACGLDGVISVAANAFPEKFSSMIRKALDHNFKEAWKMNADFLEAYDLMFIENNPAGIKAFLTELNIIQNFFRLPVIPVTDITHKKINEYLKGFKDE